MRLVKIIPKSQRAIDLANKHGEIVELLLIDKDNRFMVRSLQETFKHELGESVFGKWIGSFKEEEATWEEV